MTLLETCLADSLPIWEACCRAIFRACSEHELHFWEMSARPRTDI